MSSSIRRSSKENVKEIEETGTFATEQISFADQTLTEIIEKLKTGFEEKHSTALELEQAYRQKHRELNYVYQKFVEYNTMMLKFFVQLNKISSSEFINIEELNTMRYEQELLMRSFGEISGTMQDLTQQNILPTKELDYNIVVKEGNKEFEKINQEREKIKKQYQQHKDEHAELKQKFVVPESNNIVVLNPTSTTQTTQQLGGEQPSLESQSSSQEQEHLNENKGRIVNPPNAIKKLTGGQSATTNQRKVKNTTLYAKS